MRPQIRPQGDEPPAASEASPAGGTGPRRTRVESLHRASPLVVPLILISVLLGPHLLGLRSLSPADQLYAFEPWHSVEKAGITPTHAAPFSDNFDAVFPARHELVNRIRSGDWPLWSTLSGGGNDLTNNIGTAAAAPSALVALVTPGWYTPALLKALELLGAWGFIFLFLRRVGVARWPASLAGAVYALSGFEVVWVNWPHTRVAMFAAGVMWAFDRLIEKTSPDRIVVAALLLAATITEGFPAVAVTGIGAAAIVVLVRLAYYSTNFRDGIRRTIAAAAAALLGGAMTAAVTIPFASVLTSTGLNRGVPDDFGAARAIGTIFAPNALGRAETYFGPLNYIEMVGFFGATAVLLIVAGVASMVLSDRVRKLPAIDIRDALLVVTVVAGLVMLAFSYGLEPIYDLFRRLPLLSTNSPSRIKAPALMLLSLSAGLGLDSLLRTELSKTRRWIVAALGVIVAAVICKYLWGFADLAKLDRDFVRREVVRAIIISVLAAAAIAVVALRPARPSGRLWRNGALGMLIALVMFDAVAWVIPYWPRSQPDEFYPETPGHEFLAESLGSERFASLSLTYFPGTSAYYGLATVTGHVFYRQTWKDAIVAAGALMRSPTLSSFENPESASSPILDRLGVAYWADPAGLRRCLGTIDVLSPAQLKSVNRSGTNNPPAEESVARVSATGPGIRGISIVPTLTLPKGTKLTLRAVSTSGPGSRPIVGVRELDYEAIAGQAVTVTAVGLEKVEGAVDLSLTSTSPLGQSITQPSACMAQDDGLELAHASGTWIYRRVNSLPSIRWAARTKVETAAEQRLALLSSGEIPDDTVVLSERSTVAVGGNGRITHRERGRDRIDVDVKADGPGMVVIADPIQVGWVATVDGKRVELLEADHAGVAVPVTAGNHSVELNYQPKGYKAGVLISTLAVLTALALLALWGWQVSRGRLLGGVSESLGEGRVDEDALGDVGDPQ